MSSSGTWSGRRLRGRPAVNADQPDPLANGAKPARSDGHPTPSRDGHRPVVSGAVSTLDRVTLQLGVAVAVVIALCSYAVSATSLYALGVQAGYSWWQAAAVPVVADGPAIYGMFRIVSRSRRGAKGAGYGWLLVVLRHRGLDRRQRRPRPTRPGRPGHRRRHPPGRAGHAGRPQGRRRRGHPPGRPGRGPRTARRALEPARPAPAGARPSDAPTPPPCDPAAGGRQPRRRALPAGPRPTDHSTVGARLQAAYAQPRPDGQPWTARTLAEAAGCGRSSAASFLQRQRPPAGEHTQ